MPTVNLVLDPDASGWIMGKFAQYMLAELTAKGCKVTITAQPDAAVEVNHFIYYDQDAGYDYGKTGVDTLMITHVDEWYKWKSLRLRLRKIDMGICMSSHTLSILRRSGLPGAKLIYINPAHDSNTKVPQIKIGFFSNLYFDERKRQHILLEALKGIDVSPFHFVIIGENWEPVVETMRQSGATVTLHKNFDRELYLAEMKSIDYLLYTGEDEGSMSFLDAILLNKKTIVTRQGFHCDIRDGITHSFSSGRKLRKIFSRLSAAWLNRVDDITGLSWENYSLKHLEVWRHLLAQKHGETVTHETGRHRDGLASLKKINPYQLFLVRDVLFHFNHLAITVRLVKSLVRRFGWKYVIRKRLPLQKNKS